MNPDQALTEWYKSLPDELQQDVACLVGLNLPNLPEKYPNSTINQLTIINEIKEIFEEWLESSVISDEQKVAKVIKGVTNLTPATP